MIALSGSITIQHETKHDHTLEIDATQLGLEAGWPSQGSIYACSTECDGESITVEVHVAPLGRGIQEVRVDSEHFEYACDNLDVDWRDPEISDEDWENSRGSL